MNLAKKIILLLLCLTCTLELFAQKKNNLDSMYRVLRSMKDDTAKVNMLNALAFGQNEPKYDTSIVLCTQSLELAKKLNWSFGEARNYNGLGALMFMKGNFKEAVPYFEKALSTLSEIEKNATEKRSRILAERSGSMGNLASSHINLGNYPAAIDYFNKALKIDEELGRKSGIATKLGNIGLLYYNKGEYAKALDYFFKASVIEERIGNKKALARHFGNIGLVYSAQKNDSRALEFQFKSLKMLELANDQPGILRTYGNIGTIYRDLGKYDKALEYFFMALPGQEKIGNQYEVASLTGNIGNVYINLHDFDRALEYHTRSLKLRRELGVKKMIGTALNNMSQVYGLQKKFDEAKKLIDESLDIAQEIDDKELLSVNYETRALLDSIKGDFKLAIADYKLFIYHRNQISNEDNTRKQTELEMQFEFDKKQVTDSIRVAEEKKISAAELRTEKNQSYSLYGGLGLVLLFSGFIYNRFRVVEKQKKIIESQKQTVELQKHIVEERNKEVMDSIYYARRIQRSLLPTEKYLQKILKK
jgi:tetratricopeptide (TPR) repeat protein